MSIFNVSLSHGSFIAEDGRKLQEIKAQQYSDTSANVDNSFRNHIR